MIILNDYYGLLPSNEHNEKILIFARAHPISFINRVFLFTALFLVPFIVVPFWFGTVKTQLAVLIVCFYYLIWIDMAFIEWFKFYYDFLIVTARQLIVVNQKGLFERVIYQCHLSQVEESTADVKGVTQSMFNYGNIKIQTAGPQEHIVIRAIAKPFEISERIMKLHDEVLKK